MPTKLNLKELRKLSCLFFVILTIFSTPIYGRESDGGVNGGGGHDVEALFKAKALELSESVLDFEEQSLALLKFDVYELYATLNETGGFFVLCAKDGDLNLIRGESKMARVFNERPGKVYLNCTDYDLEAWKKKLDWGELSNAIFILHESLRIMDFSGENNYGYSKNYIKALKNEKKIFDVLLSSSFYDKEVKCRIQINVNWVSLYKNSNLHFSKKLKFSEDSSWIGQILSESTPVGKTIHKDLIQALKKFSCLP